MMVSFKFLDNLIEIKDGAYPVLVLENKKLYRNIIRSFEKNSVSEYFVFSENYEPFEFNKFCEFIPNPLSVDLEGRKLMNKIISFFESVANDEFTLKTAELKQSVLSLAEDLSAFGDFECEYKYDIETIDIIKLMQFKIGDADSAPEELLITYVKLVSKYLKTKLFVIPDLHHFFTSEELSLIYETFRINHINLLSLECETPLVKIDCEELFIVDKDLCEIDRTDT